MPAGATSRDPQHERIGILLPCRDQKREFLEQSVGSVLAQASPHWELLVGLDPDSPAWIRDWFGQFLDDRIRCASDAGPGFARALNRLMQESRSPFVTILLSDDRYTPEAIETVLRYRGAHPGADFFHSARRCIDSEGRTVGADFPSKKSFELEHFKRFGSPVKHLLCWRRELGLRIGGMDESLSRHGCDDFEFPWRMAEHGARFQAIRECLYEYRLHNQGPRLTTDTPADEQIDILERMFAKHGATRRETCTFLQRAVESYLPSSIVGGAWEARPPTLRVHCYREADGEAWPGFSEKGGERRHFFPHRLTVIPRPGPDGAKLARRMCGITDPRALSEALLFALPQAAPDLPRELFFDDDIVWHQQQLGLPWQVATADLAVAGRDLYVTVLFSDVVQRIPRRREHKTRVEAAFKGWAHMLLNAIMDHALDAGFECVRIPSARFAMSQTDPARSVQAEMFERIYDRTVNARFDTRRDGNWWALDMRANEQRVTSLKRRLLLSERGRTICIVHDIERGMGHTSVAPDFAARADSRADQVLEEIMAQEARLNVRATYCVVGSLLDGLRRPIERGGHALGFHSFAHVLPATPGVWDRLRARLLPSRDPFRRASREPDFNELVRCREVDYRLKGYRPPQSRIGPGLHDSCLAYFNFEWLASSCSSLGSRRPFLENGVVKIPVHQDDFALHQGELDYPAWEARVLEIARTEPVAVIGLHDCYADHWLPRYVALLEKLGQLGTFRTLDEVCQDVVLTNSSWC